MDLKKLFRLMLIVLIAVLGTNLVMKEFFAPKAKPAVGNNAAPKASAGHLPMVVINPSAVKHVTLGDSKAGSPFHLEVVLSNVGAGVAKVEINSSLYRAALDSSKPLVLLKHRKGFPLAFASRSAIIPGQGMFNLKTPWTVTRIKDHTTAILKWQLLDTKEKPLALLEKIYQLNPNTWNLHVTQRIINETAHPLRIAVNLFGSTSLPLGHEETDLRTVQSATYHSASKYLDISGSPEAYQAKMLGADTAPVSLGSFAGKNRLLWIASSNRFFVTIFRPLPAGPPEYEMLDSGVKIPRINYLGNATVKRVGEKAAQADPRGVLAVELAGQMLDIPAHGQADMPFTVYCGPKKRAILAGSSHAKPGSAAWDYRVYNYLSVIQFNQGSWCSFITFSWLSLAILKLLDWIHAVVGNYGVAIMILVLFVRLLLHPLTRWGQVNMSTMQRKMAKLQPDIERIKTKYAKDKQRQQQETMQLYKEKNVNPAAGILGCLPMLLQMPIWIALYSGLQVDIDLRQASFIPGWITDLSSPDTLARFHTAFQVPIIGYSHHGQDFIAFNLLPLLLGVVFYLQMQFQMRLSPTPTDPQQKQMQKMSQFMVLVFPLFLYNAPSGLNLYICASTLGGLIDMTFIRRHLKKLEAREAATA